MRQNSGITSWAGLSRATHAALSRGLIGGAALACVLGVSVEVRAGGEALAVGAVCVLERSLPVNAAAKGGGSKTVFDVGTELTIREVGRVWVRVRVEGKGEEGYVKRRLVQKRCAVKAPRAGGAAPDAQADLAESQGDEAPVVNEMAATLDSGAELGRAQNTVLVTPLRATGVAPKEVAALSAEIARALSEAADYEVMTVQEINQMADQQRVLSSMGCIDESCVAELSKIANARLVLSGTIGRVGEEYSLTLTLMDVATTSRVGSASVTARTLDDIRTGLALTVRETLGDAGAAGGKRYSLPEGEEVSFAVLGLKPLGIDAETATNLTEVLAAEIKRIDGTKVISPSDIASMLEMQATKNTLDCIDSACLAEIGGALGVDQLIVGDVGKVGDRHVVSLRIIDARDPRALSRVTESFKGVEDQLLAAVRLSGKRLLGLELTEPGTLAVTATAHQGQIFLDDEPRGELPLRPIKELPPGRHALRVKAPGFYDWRSEIFVEPGATSLVWVEMEARPRKIAFWTLASGTAASGVGAAVFAILAKTNEDAFWRHVQNGTDPDGRISAANNATAFAMATNVLLIAAGVFAAGTGIAAIFTDWD